MNHPLSRRQLLVLIACSCLTLEGCGGSEGPRDALIVPVVSIHWTGVPTRTEAPSLAQSARVRLIPLTGAPVLEALCVRAEPSLDSVTRYPLPGTLPPGKAQLTVDFFTDREGLGLKIASGASEVEIFPDSGLVTELTITDAVERLSLPVALTLTVGETTTVRPTATLTNGTVAAIPTETLRWEFEGPVEGRFQLMGNQLTALHEGRGMLVMRAQGLPDNPHSVAMKLTALSRPPVTAQRLPLSVKLIGLAATGSLLALEWTDQWRLVSLDSRTGERQVTPTLPDSIRAYGLSPEGTYLWFYGTQTSKLFRLALTSGVLTEFPALKVGTPLNIIPLRGETTRVIVQLEPGERTSRYLALEAGAPVENFLEGYYLQALAGKENEFFLWESYPAAQLTRYQFDGSGLTQKESRNLPWQAQTVGWDQGRLYFGGRGIVDGQSYAQLGDFNAPPACGNLPPSLSPSGKRALFTAYLGDRLVVLYIYEVATQQKLVEHWYEQVREDLSPTALWADEHSVVVSDFASLTLLPNLLT